MLCTCSWADQKENLQTVTSTKSKVPRLNSWTARRRRLSSEARLPGAQCAYLLSTFTLLWKSKEQMKAGTVKGPVQTLQAEKLNGFWQRKQIKSPICVQFHLSHKKKKRILKTRILLCNKYLLLLYGSLYNINHKCIEPSETPVAPVLARYNMQPPTLHPRAWQLKRVLKQAK